MWKVRGWAGKGAALTALVLVGLGMGQGVGGTVTLALTEEPDTLDPQKTSTAVTGLILRYAADTLITKDPKGKYVAGLAASWEVSNDGLTWTFQLKSGVKFSNGDPLDAAAVKASIERAIDPATKSPIAADLYGKVGSVTVVAPRVLRIQLKEAFSPFLDNLTDPRAAIVNARAAQAAGDQFGRAPVLSGPWKVASWRSGDRIVLERNPDYNWGPAYVHRGAPYIQQLIFRVIPDAATQVTAFQANEVQILPTVPPTNVRQLQSAGTYQFFSFLRTGVGLFLEFNTTKAPFDDLRVRQALNYAIAKEPIVRIALQGLGEVACGPLPPSISGYWDGICDYAPKTNLDKAKELLAQAGWKSGADGVLNKDGKPFEFTLYTAPIDTWTQSAQIVQAQLQSLGIKMNIQTFEFGTLLDKLKKGEQQAHFMGYTYTSPDILYLWFHSSNIGTGLNLSHFKDATLDGLIDRSRKESRAELRDSIYRDIQKYIVDKALWVPLWINQNYVAVQPQIKGIQISNQGFVVLMDAYVSR